jgi:hypothetical protein
LSRISEEPCYRARPFFYTIKGGGKEGEKDLWDYYLGFVFDVLSELFLFLF